MSWGGLTLDVGAAAEVRLMGWLETLYMIKVLQHPGSISFAL